VAHTSVVNLGQSLVAEAPSANSSCCSSPGTPSGTLSVRHNCAWRRC
jgi:hypothetical protein